MIQLVAVSVHLAIVNFAPAAFLVPLDKKESVKALALAESFRDAKAQQSAQSALLGILFNVNVSSTVLDSNAQSVINGISELVDAFAEEAGAQEPTLKFKLHQELLKKDQIVEQTLEQQKEQIPIFWNPFSQTSLLEIENDFKCLSSSEFIIIILNSRIKSYNFDLISFIMHRNK